MTNREALAGLLAAALGLAPAEAARGAPDEKSAPSAAAGGFIPVWGDATPFRLQLEGEGMLDADYGAAEVSWARSIARLRLRGPVSERVELAFRLYNDYAAFDFDGDTSSLPLGAGGGDPFDDLIDSGARFGASVRIRESWMVLGEGYVQSKLERGAELDSSWKGGGILGVGHRFFEGLDVAVALKIGTKLDHHGAYVWPNVRVRWQISDDWDLDLSNLQLRVTRELGEQWSLTGFTALRSQRYRLADRDDGPGGVGEGTIGNRFVPIGIEAQWRPRPRLRLLGGVGVVVWQRLKVNDEHGDEFASDNTSEFAPLLTLQVEARF